jgi:MoxR-like ATPase
LHGRYHVTTEDIAALAKPVLRHRLICNFAAQAGGLNTDIIVDRLVEHLNKKVIQT